MVKGDRNIKNGHFEKKGSTLTAKKVRCYKCTNFRVEGNYGFCERFGWLVDLTLARHQRLCHYG
jgi:hypothetical protein